MIRHFLNPPNWFTSASLFCSVYALTILLSDPEPSSRTFVRACILVVFGGIFDSLDGRVARLTKRQSDFGIQLDSIADVIGFGIAPAAIAWSWKLHELGFFGVLITFWYVLAAAFRLARFNVSTADEHDAWPFAGHTQGLTSTMSGGILVAFVWVSEGYLVDRYGVPPRAFAGFIALLGYLMVSSIPFRNFKNMRDSGYARAIFAITAGTCLTSALVMDPSMLFGMGAVLYLFGGLADGIGIAIHHRRLGRALLVLDEDDEDIWSEDL